MWSRPGLFLCTATVVFICIAFTLFFPALCSLLCTSGEIQQYLLNDQMNQLICNMSWQDNVKVILRRPLSDVTLVFPKCDKKNHNRRAGKRKWVNEIDWTLTQGDKCHLGKNVSCWKYKWRPHYGGQECKRSWGCIKGYMKGSGEWWPGKDCRGRKGGLRWMENCQGEKKQQIRFQGNPGGECQRRLFWLFNESSWTITGKHSLS